MKISNKQEVQKKLQEVKVTNSASESLKSKVLFLENQNQELLEQIDELMQAKEVLTFQGGRYTNVVREVYATLLSLNVGVKNVENVVRVVLNKLSDVNIGRLPKRSDSELMLVEAKALAQIQSAEAILSSENCTLHTDGTKRGGKEFGGLQIGTEKGQFSLGLTEIARGDTNSFMKMLRDVFTDVSKLVDKENVDSKVAEIVSKIKNMMTDRHIVNDSIKNSLESWKNECLPLIIQNFNEFPDAVKAKLIEINHFKCNLHVLVNLATQAETALKEWEKSVTMSDEMDPNPHTCMSFSTPDFIRATTKLCVPGADQKSGYGLLFKSYLDSLDDPVELQLSTFHGHRINILFSMAASVYFHINDIRDFCKTYFNEKSNLLVASISFYTSSNVHIAGCRALGIIDKLLTGPLWRHIENSEHILDLNDIWFVFLRNLERFSQDASELISGNPIFPDFTIKDKIYDMLFKPFSEEVDLLTLEALQILCTNFLIIIHRQLGDNLPGGKFSKEGAENYDELKQQSMKVSNTNIISERDFANLDRLQREKPNANVIALEGMILFTNNKTLNWLETLETSKKEKVFDTARKCAPKMVEDYRKRKSELKTLHIEMLRKKKEEIINQEKKKNAEIVKLGQDIEQFGGFWKSEIDVFKNLKKLKNSQKLDASNVR